MSGSKEKREYTEPWERHVNQGKCLANKYIGDEVYLCGKRALHKGECGDWLFWYVR